MCRSFLHLCDSRRTISFPDWFEQANLRKWYIGHNSRICEEFYEPTVCCNEGVAHYELSENAANLNMLLSGKVKLIKLKSRVLTILNVSQWFHIEQTNRMVIVSQITCQQTARKDMSGKANKLLNNISLIF